MFGLLVCAALATVPVPAAAAVDQTPPPSINGIVVDGDSIWVASIAGDEVLRVDATTGEIRERYDTHGAAPDDVAIGPDGAVYTTGHGNGDVGRVADGSYTVVTTLEPGINPLELSADGLLYVGQEIEGGTVWQVPLDGSAPVVVATGLPSINAFAVLDGAVIAPAGGFGPGSVIAIDTVTGAVTTVADSFPTSDGEPPMLLASAADTDDNYFALANITGEVFHVDLASGAATLAWTFEGGPFDNLAFGGSTVYLSRFGDPAIVALDADATTRTIPVGDPALIPATTVGA